jgi:pilus assembly protein Flp/PilA
VAYGALQKPGDFLTVDQAFDRRLAGSNPVESLSMVISLTRLIKDDRGATAIEYGLIAALIAVGSLVAVNSVNLSLNLTTTFSKVASKL